MRYSVHIIILSLCIKFSININRSNNMIIYHYVPYTSTPLSIHAMSSNAAMLLFYMVFSKAREDALKHHL